MIPWDKIIEAGKRAKELGFRRIYVQIPEGILPWAKRVYQLLKNIGLDPVVSIDPTYGACDLHFWKAKSLGCEAILHVGHERIPSIEEEIPVLYAPLRYSIIDEDLILRSCKEIRERRIGIVSTIQYSHLLKEVRKKYEESGKEAYVGGKGGRIFEEGQVLGCNVESARKISDKVDAFVFYGDGTFHAIAVRGATGKRTYVVDPLKGEIRDVEEEFQRIYCQRMIAIGEASSASSFGIFVTSKIGQYSERALRACRELLEREGREYCIFHQENLDERANYIKRIDAIVFIGCPRVVYDESPRYRIPLLTPSELEIALGLKKPEDWKFEEIGW